ncbi:endo alpha-1,4 polygalactosaminidase [Microbacterium sp. Se63.02b]|nr:endo alpha-1,4 polygalactosaminidase [Microbacterium sp. Se63.02b]
MIAAARAALLSCAAVVLVALGGCAATSTMDSVVLPPAGAVPDYQLGGSYEPASEVGIVGRDRSADPAPDVYSICYVNGFQTQPGELDTWPEDLLLHRDGEVVFDPDWPDEAVLDTASRGARERIADTVTPWIEGCADAGFDAVEFDNLDSYTRSAGALTLDDNLALAALFVDAAHSSGLAAGQKNAAEDAAVLHERAGFDFAVTEECAAYTECDAYTDVYGDHVIDIEYTDELPRPFAEMCDDDTSPASMVLRDRELVTPEDDDHVFEICP